MTDEGKDRSYRRAPGWVWRTSRQQVLLVGPEGDANRLRGAAASVWMVLEEPATPSDLSARIAAAVGEDDDLPAEEDRTAAVHGAVAALVEAGLIVGR